MDKLVPFLQKNFEIEIYRGYCGNCVFVIAVLIRFRILMLNNF
jgi:hypothetical protein